MKMPDTEEKMFVTSLPARQIGAVIVETARRCGILKGPVHTASELAVFEKFLFVKLFDAVRRESLTPDEINSLFNFVFARSAEAVTRLLSGKSEEPYEFDAQGLFDGTAPFSAAPEIALKMQRNVSFPTRCAENFLEAAEYIMQHSSGGAEPRLLLFEALKWCFRFGCHLALDEENNTNQQ